MSMTTETSNALGEEVRRLVGKLDQWRHCISHNESYFGEPAGLVKATVAELARAVDPIYPPKPEPIDPLAGVVINAATIPLSGDAPNPPTPRDLAYAEAANPRASTPSAPVGTAPPPAAARGDVRGLVADRAAIKLLVAAGFVTEAKANEALLIAHGFAPGPLAAEGVQAGEVEQRARELFADWHRQRGCSQKIIDDCLSGVIQMPELAMQLVTAALSQQPEARGVVDESLRRDADRWRKLMANTKSDHIWHFALSEEQKAGHDHFLDVIDALPLTGERNG